MNKVLILVSGGVAEVIYADTWDIDVVIFDEDNNDDFSMLPRWAQEVLLDNEMEF